MENGKQGAFACADQTYLQNGLTKLEYFAGIAMQGILAHSGTSLPINFCAEMSINYANAMLSQLEKTKQQEK